MSHCQPQSAVIFLANRFTCTAVARESCELMWLFLFCRSALTLLDDTGIDRVLRTIWHWLSSRSIALTLIYLQPRSYLVLVLSSHSWAFFVAWPRCMQILIMLDISVSGAFRGIACAVQSWYGCIGNCVRMGGPRNSTSTWPVEILDRDKEAIPGGLCELVLALVAGCAPLCPTDFENISACCSYLKRLNSVGMDSRGTWCQEYKRLHIWSLKLWYPCESTFDSLIDILDDCSVVSTARPRWPRDAQPRTTRELDV